MPAARTRERRSGPASRFSIVEIYVFKLHLAQNRVWLRMQEAAQKYLGIRSRLFQAKLSRSARRPRTGDKMSAMTGNDDAGYL